MTRTRQSRAASTSPAKRTLLRLAIAAGLTGGSATARTTIEVRPLAGRLAAALVLGTAEERRTVCMAAAGFLLRCSLSLSLSLIVVGALSMQPIEKTLIRVF